MRGGEFLERIERSGAVEMRDGGIQPTAGDDQQRKAGTGFLIVDANFTLLDDRHGVPPVCLGDVSLGSAKRVLSIAGRGYVGGCYREIE